jgi:hypothetical protein
MTPLSGFGLLAIAFGLLEMLIRKSLGRSAFQQWTAMGQTRLAKTPEWWTRFTWIPVIVFWVLGLVLFLVGLR